MSFQVNLNSPSFGGHVVQNDLVKEIMRKNEDGNYLDHEQYLLGRIQTVINVNELFDGHTLLYYALKNGKEKVVEALLEKGANPNIGTEPEECLEVCDNMRLAALLHQGGMHCTPKARTFAYKALKIGCHSGVEGNEENGKLKKVERLLLFWENDINAKMENGDTLIHHLCRAMSGPYYVGDWILDHRFVEEFFIEFLKRKPDLNIKNDQGLTPYTELLKKLDRTVSKNEIELLLLLLENGTVEMLNEKIDGKTVFDRMNAFLKQYADAPKWIDELNEVAKKLTTGIRGDAFYEPQALKFEDYSNRIQQIIHEAKLETAIPALSSFKEENWQRANQYLSLARSVEDEKEALTNYTLAFLHTNSLEAYAEVPALYETKGQVEKASLAYLNLGLYQLQRGSAVEALQTFNKCKTLNPRLNIDSLILGLTPMNDPLDVNNAMAIAAAQSDPEEKAAIYKQVLVYDPLRLDAYEALIPLLKTKGSKKYFLDKEEEATALVEKANPPQILPGSISITPEDWANPQALMSRLPPMPQAFVDFLAGPCPIWAGRKASETHIVVPLIKYIILNGIQVPRTLHNLDLLDKASGGRGFESIDSYVDKNSSYKQKVEFEWGAMTKVGVPGTGKDSFCREKEKVKAKGYEAPSLLDAATCILWQNRHEPLEAKYSFYSAYWAMCQEFKDRKEAIIVGYSPQLLIGGNQQKLRVSNSCDAMMNHETKDFVVLRRF